MAGNAGWATSVDGVKPLRGDPSGGRTQDYEPPVVVWLGCLDKLTRGGTVGVPDGNGFAGATGTQLGSH